MARSPERGGVGFRQPSGLTALRRGEKEKRNPACPLTQPDGAHAVVQPPRPEPCLGDFETGSLFFEEVLKRDDDVVEVHLEMAERGVVVVVRRHRGLDFDSWGEGGLADRSE